MTITDRALRHWKRILSAGMPDDLTCSLTHKAAARQGIGAVAFEFNAHKQDTPVFYRRETLDLQTRITLVGSMKSSGHKHGYKGLGALYMWNMATGLAPLLGLAMHYCGGADAGGQYWQRCGFELDYPKECKDNPRQQRDLKLLHQGVELRCKAAERYSDKPLSPEIKDALAQLCLAAEMGYAENPRLLWPLADDRTPLRLPEKSSLTSAFLRGMEPSVEFPVRPCGPSLLAGTVYDIKFDWEDEMALRRLRHMATRGQTQLQTKAA